MVWAGILVAIAVGLGLVIYWVTRLPPTTPQDRAGPFPTTGLPVDLLTLDRTLRESRGEAVADPPIGDPSKGIVL